MLLWLRSGTAVVLHTWWMLKSTIVTFDWAIGHTRKTTASAQWREERASTRNPNHGVQRVIQLIKIIIDSMRYFPWLSRLLSNQHRRQMGCFGQEHDFRVSWGQERNPKPSMSCLFSSSLQIHHYLFQTSRTCGQEVQVWPTRLQNSA